MERDHGRKTRQLQHRDELVSGRRNDDAHSLRDDHAAQDSGPRHSQGPPGELLSRIDGQKPGSDDLGHICRLVQREGDKGSEERLEPARRKGRPELWQRIPNEDQLQQRRRCPEDPVVEEDDAANRAVAASTAQCQKEADRRCGRKRHDRELECEKRSLPVRTGSERFPKNVLVEARQHERLDLTSRHSQGSAVSSPAS